MAAPKRTPFQIKRDRAVIAHLYSRGRRQDEIARILSEDPERNYTLTRTSITRDIRIIQEEWVRTSVQSIDKVKARALATLDEMEREAWERSKKSKIKKKAQTRTTAAGADGKAGPSSQAAERWEEDQNGDPRWMDILLKIVDRRCKILGIDAPVEVKWRDITDRVPWKELTNEQLKRITNREPLESVIPGFSTN